jgi:uncharacterized protein YgiM (DUF1202 family)
MIVRAAIALIALSAAACVQTRPVPPNIAFLNCSVSADDWTYLPTVPSDAYREVREVLGSEARTTLWFKDSKNADRYLYCWPTVVDEKKFSGTCRASTGTMHFHRDPVLGNYWNLDEINAGYCTPNTP